MWFHLPTESPFNPLTMDGVSPFILNMLLSVGCKCLQEDAFTKLAGQAINNTSRTGRWGFLAVTSPPDATTQMRFCLKEIHIWRETGESTLALHQIKSELPPAACERVRMCVCPRTGSWFDWVTGVRPALAAQHLSVFMLTSPGGDASASVTTRREDKLFVQQLVSHQTLLHYRTAEDRSLLWGTFFLSFLFIGLL